MLINLSNHPSSTWTNKQSEAAIAEYHSITDIEFPNIDPFADETSIDLLADKYLAKCRSLLVNDKNLNNAVHIMGEHTFVAKLITKLQLNNIKCIASTTERISSTVGNNKITEFKFVKFREYTP